MAKFGPSPHRDEALKFLREGIQEGKDVKELKEESVRRFGIALRTADNYVKEINSPKPPKLTTVEKTKIGLNTVNTTPQSPPVNPTVEPDKTAENTQVPQAPSGQTKPIPQTKQTVLDVVGPTLVNFRFYNDPVQINLAYLEGAYGDYKKIIRLDPSIEDTFEEAVVGAMRYVLTSLRKRAAREFVLIMEEDDNANVSGPTAG
ncbi:MAG: hypothetical protein PHI12_07720 [Dehalococcoidales bacterium]|nr:hypothetical protein [Dehalococcoidales bacterium]